MAFDAAELAALRPRLLAFCAQLLGSPFEAEDAVQDVFERALRAQQSFDPGLASLSTWCLRIARNICVDRLRAVPRRALPRDLHAPDAEVLAPLVPAMDVPWLMPAPGSWFPQPEPERLAEQRQAVRFAVTAMLQQLPPRQRGVLVLRDVLGYSAVETAAILELSTASVNSALLRARARVRATVPDRPPVSRDQVERYARALESADVAALARLVADDVVLEMPPVPNWSRGRDAYAGFMSRLFAWRGIAWRFRTTSVAGLPALVLLHVGPEGPTPHTLQLLDGTEDGIDHVLVYQHPGLLALFSEEPPPDR